MKKKIWLLILLGVFLVDCSKDVSIKIEKVEILNESDAPDIIKLSEKASVTLLDSLKSELLNVLKTDGSIAAIDVCSKKAMKITSVISEEFNINIKRTSMKYRNPMNKPDEYEMEALRHFERKLKTNGVLPVSYIQKISTNKQTFYNYYKPISIGQPCILCHGKTNEISGDLLKAIMKIYPEDKARDYNVGDFRGLVRVRITDSVASKI